MEYDENGNLAAKYHHDGGGLMAMTRNNTSYWYVFEAIGTARQLMDGQGQVLDAYAYDAWGNELTRPQSPIPNPFKYVGKHGYYLDTESALMLLGVRYYRAGTGHFLTPDPIVGNFLQINQRKLSPFYAYFYAYAQNEPTKVIDPTGLWGFIVTPISGCICVPLPVVTIPLCLCASIEWRCCCGPAGWTCRWFIQVCVGVGSPGGSIGAGGGVIINYTHVGQTGGFGGCVSGGIPIIGIVGLCGNICAGPGWVVSIELQVCLTTPGVSLSGCWSF